MKSKDTSAFPQVYAEGRNYTEKFVEELAQLGDLVNAEMNTQVFYPYECMSTEKKGKFSVFYSADGKVKIFNLKKVPIDTLRISEKLKDKLRALVSVKDKQHEEQVKLFTQ